MNQGYRFNLQQGDRPLKTDISDPAAPSPFSVNNVRMFIAFRVFFNCRFYYPIFTVLFLDFGLSVAQFSILNAVWAATIVMAEVPSGALADILGRRRLLVFAAVSMLVEMAILCLAPRGNIGLLFGFFLVNRVLSGLAEAAASGADEAIAYDALQAEGMADQWGRVLDVQMRLRSVMFILTMTIGAAVYDPDLMTRVMAFFRMGSPVHPDADPAFSPVPDLYTSPVHPDRRFAPGRDLPQSRGGWHL